jgi:hypothetical protein
MTNELDKVETAENGLREPKAYHTPKLVNLGEIHALVMSGGGGCTDLSNSCAAS